MTQTYILCGGMRIFANGTLTALCHFYGHRLFILGGAPCPQPVIIYASSFNSPQSTAPAR